MSKTIKCDVCGRTQPDVDCRYSRKKKFGWFRRDDDSQGGCDSEIDLCTDCYLSFQMFIEQRQKIK